MSEITNDQKLELLIDFGADAHTLTTVATVLNCDDFSDLADALIGDFTGEGKYYTIEDWARLSRSVSSIFE